MDKAVFKVGDTIKVYTKDVQDQKVHATPFEGIVIVIRGNNANRTFTMRRVSTGGTVVERIFPFNSPTIEKINIVKEGKTRRAKLYVPKLSQ